MIVLKNCELEWDIQRGVLYVHNQDTGGTVLRICGLDTKTKGTLTKYGQMIDITRPEHVEYPR
jgi:hypothetical protein